MVSRTDLGLCCRISASSHVEMKSASTLRRKSLAYFSKKYKKDSSFRDMVKNDENFKWIHSSNGNLSMQIMRAVSTPGKLSKKRRRDGTDRDTDEPLAQRRRMA